MINIKHIIAALLCSAFIAAVLPSDAAVLTMVRHHFFDNSGNACSGCKVYIYEPGTTTPKNSYTDSTGTIPNTNPVILDTKGEASIWTTGMFKVNLTDSNDVQITGYPVDNLGYDITSQSFATAIHNATNKTTPANADEVGIWDSVSGLLNKLTWANIWNQIKSLINSAPVAFNAGTVSAPAIYMDGDASTGLYRIGANNDGYAISGVKVLDISSGGLGVSGDITTTGGALGGLKVDAQDGRLTFTGALSAFINSPNTNMYLGGQNIIFTGQAGKTTTFRPEGTYTAATVSSSGLAVSGVTLTNSFAANLITNSGATYSVLPSDHTIIQTTTGSTYTLPSAATNFGRMLRILNQSSGAIISASSNVIPISGGAATTAILPATAGKWADLQSDGVDWETTAGN